MASQPNTGRASALPLNLIAQAVPRLSRHDLEALTERLIDRLDEIDPDADSEPCAWNERPSQAKWPRNREGFSHDDHEEDDPPEEDNEDRCTAADDGLAPIWVLGRMHWGSDSEAGELGPAPSYGEDQSRGPIGGGRCG